MDDRSRSVYYTGDTGHYGIFSRVYGAFGAADLMMADRGQYGPARPSAHTSPERSVQAARVSV